MLMRGLYIVLWYWKKEEHNINCVLGLGLLLVMQISCYKYVSRKCKHETLKNFKCAII
jgi:hypothetical protein